MPVAVDAVIIKQLGYYAAKGDSVKPLDQMLEQVRCQRFAECVRSHVEHMARSRSTSRIAKQLREQAKGIQ